MAITNQSLLADRGCKETQAMQALCGWCRAFLLQIKPIKPKKDNIKVLIKWQGGVNKNINSTLLISILEGDHLYFFFPSRSRLASIDRLEEREGESQQQ